MPDGTSTEKIAPTGVYCTNCKAELQARNEALKLMEEVTADQSGAKVVILISSKSVLQKLEDPKTAEEEYFRDALQKLEKETETLILQRIRSHCKIDVNEKADRLAREGSVLELLSVCLTNEEAIHVIKSLMKEKLKTRHPHHNKPKGLN
ncbi:Gag-Pol polyprotein [Elysia marginata]|uniref:Gag-Pol polyprotein n=1 Tax=Elysia marginata TaxID=1093978 RepID=A0AAV4J4L4_9GAST|nr:Gag-Pol polyprotein [Elysia marginata]